MYESCSLSITQPGQVSPPLFESSGYNTSLWWKTYTLVPVSVNWKKSGDFNFYKKKKKARIKMALSVLQPALREAAHTPWAARVAHAPSWGTTLNISASWSLELWTVWAPVPNLHLRGASPSGMYPKVSEKLKRDYFLGLGMPKKFSM